MSVRLNVEIFAIFKAGGTLFGLIWAKEMLSIVNFVTCLLFDQITIEASSIQVVVT